MDALKAIKKTLKHRIPATVKTSVSHYMHASVLIPLFMENGGYKVLFTERSYNVEHHKGQISFPGGAVDEKDNSLEETALRESYEEIGLLAEDVEILGQIDDVPTVTSRFIIHPFVGQIPSHYSFKINPGEVESIITVPLRFFFDKKDHAHLDGLTYHGTTYEYQNHIIWGATAIIMENFISLAGDNLCLPQDSE
ncbi:CoA pyrophosphatase [Deltaproteobacteria bacterium]|nr:CoA pyrophosphatase [Deltaproteobacteria bacterium]